MAYKMIKRDDKSVVYKIDTNDDFIDLLANRASYYSLQPEIVEFVLDYCKSVEDCFRYAQKIIEYKKDSKAGEIILSPVEIVKRLRANKRVAGDCDDKSLFLASILLAMGYPVRLVAAHFIDGTEKSKSDMSEVNHVFVQYYDEKKKQWINLEPSSKSYKVGQKSPKVIALKYYHATPLVEKDVSANIEGEYKIYTVLRNTGKMLKTTGSLLENVSSENINRLRSLMTTPDYVKEAMDNPVSVAIMLYSIIITGYLILSRRKQ